MDDVTRAQALRKMKAVATGLLVVLAVIFCVAFALQDQYPWLGYVRAAAEGGMVGALADWFAVTALFKHPMGLKIPHTAIIPRKKDQIGETLGGFVEENFLSDEVLKEKLGKLNVAVPAGAWLSEPANSERVAKEGATVIRGVLEVVEDEDVLRLVETLAKKHMLAPEWSSTLGRVLETIVRDNHHAQLVDLLVTKTYEWVQAHPERVTAMLSSRSPSWVPRSVDMFLGEKVYLEIVKFLSDVNRDKDHMVRRSITEWLHQVAQDMQKDPATIAKVERLKHSLLGDPQLRELAATSWSSIKAALLDAVENPESELRKSFVRAVADLGRRLQEDQTLARKVDAWVRNAAIYVATTYRHQAASLITETVALWDGEETSRKIELQVGRDLQFIRINGTVVGSLAGLAIYALASALFH
ncbi:uncharacterized membrane-anchored protein YjiN (DUF445 family) [Neomicrococcus aestuarii]|uniref:Uncharacterized membrane-anchored protein YjiN (DUF445 family) n=1 Tax=Neomicrococcus aestuarii TaxID=556325 RepID=A0A7W8TTJ9_9MICC|nr:DUF445 domain-containing protein [Neomicrococcus aestuarii]MBB5512672.1 uncharacterized membrane-anchored protein YjiN (DUF445 family) [Neomicrococcus aestuarii]